MPGRPQPGGAATTATYALADAHANGDPNVATDGVFYGRCLDIYTYEFRDINLDYYDVEPRDIKSYGISFGDGH